MLIGFDGSRAFNKDRTGTENYSYQLLLHLSKIDRENTYLVYLRPGAQVNREDWPSNFQFSIINFPRLWTQIGLALRTFKDPLDLLFVPSHTLPLIRSPFIKTVMSVHDLGAEYLPWTHQIKQRLYLSFITNFQLKSATKLIAVSQATKEDLVKKVGVKKEMITVVYEGVDRNLFKPKEGVVLSNSLKQFGVVPGGYFLFVGTIQPRKNLERLIRAYAQANVEPELVLVGAKGWLSDKIYKLPKKLGIEDRVKFLGRVEDTKLPALYSGAQAFLFPSLFEGFGLPILEAFSCNCPVLTSKTSSMPEVAGKAAILIDPYDIDSISDGIKKTMGKDIRSKLIKEGREQLKQFSWESAAQKTLGVLTDA
jgi:glycosyltransferase involved in cell wall biosynthesis